MAIVQVQFQNRFSGTYSGNAYTYYADNPVQVGDIVKVPTQSGESEAKVCRVDVPESEIPSWMVLKHITEPATPGGSMFDEFFTSK